MRTRYSFVSFWILSRDQTTMNAVGCLLLLVLAVTLVLNMKVIPERAKIVYYNTSYGEGGKFYVKRYNRRGNYYINLEGTIYHTWANNMTAHFYFYEFLHNEYKRSFVEMHYKFCDLVNKEEYIGQALAAVGVVCPAPPRKYMLNNITVPTDNFPNVFPFEKCKVEIKVNQSPTQDLVLHLEIYVTMKQKLHG